MRIANVIASLCLTGLGLLAIFWLIPSQTVEVDPGELPGSLLPTLAAWLVVGASAVQLIQSLRSNRRFTQQSDAGKTSLLFFVGCAVTLSAILIAIAKLGYVIGGAVGVIAVGLMMRPTGAARWWLVIVAAIIPAAIYYLAWEVLRLSLP